MPVLGRAPPPLPRPPRIFWGWWVFLGASVGQFVTVGFGLQVTGVFLEPMSESLGWARSQFVLAGSLGFIVGGFAAFFVGPLIDRHGARPLMLVGATIAGFVFLVTSQVEELWQFIALRGLVGQIGLLMTGPLVVNVALSKWFVHRRGAVISLASVGISLGGILPPILLTRVVDNGGWESGWIVLSAATVLLIYPVALLMRRQPEDYGLSPDGDTRSDGSPPSADEARRQALADQDLLGSYTRAEALRTPALWVLIAAVAFGVAAAGSLGVHAIPLLTDAGFSRSEAALLFGTHGSFSLVSKFAWAWALQRYSVKPLAVLTMSSLALALLLLVTTSEAGSLPLMFPVAALWGSAVGGFLPITEFIWASYFGRRHLGAVRSTGLPISVIFGGAAPVLAGLYFDRVGDYRGAFFALALCLLVSATLMALARRPPPKRAAPAPARQPR